VVIDWLVLAVNVVARVLILLIVLQWILSYFVDYYNPVRHFVERIVDPMLAPIRRSVPLIGMFDISPLILLMMIYALQYAIVSLLLIFR
jgi:YggT family protein